MQDACGEGRHASLAVGAGDVDITAPFLGVAQRGQQGFHPAKAGRAREAGQALQPVKSRGHHSSSLSLFRHRMPHMRMNSRISRATNSPHQTPEKSSSTSSVLEVRPGT